MMKPTSWLLLILFLLAGCAITYTHPTKSAKDFERDERECEVIAKKALVAKGIPNT
jgi:PBP1b-binding outer membrane lipoprotein LpoB